MDYIFYQVAAVNGFDQFGHYLRAGLIVNLCSTYATSAGVGLLGELQRRHHVRELATRARASSISSRPAPRRWRGNVARGHRAKPREAEVQRRRQAGDRPAEDRPARPARPDPLAGHQAEGDEDRRPEPQVASPLGGPAATQAPDPRQGLLDYLLGSGS